MQRRKFIQNISLASGAILLWPGCENSNQWHRVFAGKIDAPAIPFPPEKRVPLGWGAFPIGINQAATILTFPDTKETKQKVWLRITAAIDFRESKKITASLAQSKTKLGVFDIRFAHPFQPFQIEIEGRYLKQIRKEGIALNVTEGTKDTWFFTSEGIDEDAPGLRPQLLYNGDFDAEKSLMDNMYSMNSFSPFGWLGGCVQDSLYEMARNGDKKAEQTLKRQLNNYLDDDKGITFENPHTVPIDGRFNSIEDFLPFTGVVYYYPQHKVVQVAVDYMLSKEEANGLIATGHITTEGCYTLAYPMAAIAVARKDETLANKAIQQLVFRKQLLTDEKSIYQRAGENGPEGYANWGRGTVWYLLGMVKTLHVLKEGGFGGLSGIQEMEAEFKRGAAFVAQWQNAEGMWCSFLNRPETKIDTTASSGLGAAFAWGHKMGYLDAAYNQKAIKAYNSLLSYITPDGFLTGVSQINRGGEELQANGYRVISQFAMGLLAQLKSILNHSKEVSGMSA